MSKFQCTEEFTRKLHALLYYIHMTKYKQINSKCPRVLVIHFYRLIWFHTQKRFRASLSVRVSDSVQPVTPARECFTNNTGHKIYQYVPARSTRHYMRLHNSTIIHTKIFFEPACHPRNKILYKEKLSQSSLIHSHLPHMSSSTSKYNSNTNLSRNIYLFRYLGLGLGLGLGYNHPLVRNRYISIHNIIQVACYFYVYVIFKYYHTNKDGGALDKSILFSSIPH